MVRRGKLDKKEDSRRIGFIDQCKGIGILLMILGHCVTLDWKASINGTTTFFLEWISSFHMPLFFILGGCLLAYKKEAFSFPKTLAKNTAVPYLSGCCNFRPQSRTDRAVFRPHLFCE